MSGKIPFLTKGPMALFFGGKYRLSGPLGSPGHEKGLYPPGLWNRCWSSSRRFWVHLSTQIVQKFPHFKQTTKLRILWTKINHCAQFSGRFYSISWWSFCKINRLASCRLECSFGGIRQYASNKLFPLWVNCPFHTSPHQVNPLFYSWKLNLYQPAWWSW